MLTESEDFTALMEERCAAISEGDRVSWEDGGTGVLRTTLELGVAWIVQDLPIHRVWATQDEDYESLDDLVEGRFHFPTMTDKYEELLWEIAKDAAGMLTDVIRNLDHKAWHGQKVDTIEAFWYDRFAGKYPDNKDRMKTIDSFLTAFLRGRCGIEFGFTRWNGQPVVQWRAGAWSGLLSPFVSDTAHEKPEVVHTNKCLCMKCSLDLDGSEELFFLDEGKPSASDAVKCGCGKGVKTRFILATSGRRGISKFTTNQPGSYGAVETTLHLPGCTNPYCSMPNRAITRRLFDCRGNDWRKLKQNVFRIEAREKARRKRRKN